MEERRRDGAGVERRKSGGGERVTGRGGGWGEESRKGVPSTDDHVTESAVGFK